MTIKQPTVIGNFYVQPGKYVATVNQDVLKLHNMKDLGLVAEVYVARKGTNRPFAMNKEDLTASGFKNLKAKDLKKLDLGGTSEAVVIESPKSVTS